MAVGLSATEITTTIQAYEKESLCSTMEVCIGQSGTYHKSLSRFLLY